MRSELVKYKRLLNMELPSNQSAFLFGARKTGKSTYLEEVYPNAIRYDLLKSDVYLRLAKGPHLFREEILALSKLELSDPVIVDEVQTGMGRTGKFLAHEHEGVCPDGVILGKALGGGLLPVSMFLSREEVMNVFTPGDHGSTFGGNPLAASVGIAALDVLFEENLIERAAELGAYLQEQLHKIKSKLILEIRGTGLLVGLMINPRYHSARDICLRLLKYGVLSKETHGAVIRLAPPLIISKEQIDHVVLAISKVLHEVEATLLV